MLRIAAFAAAALLSASAFAQNYSGTFTTTTQQGGTVTLVLKQDAGKQVRGTLTGNNNTFQVSAESTTDGLMGTVTGPQGQLYLMGQFEGANLVLILAEPGPGGQPNLAAARRIVFSKKESAPQAGTGADAQLSTGTSTVAQTSGRETYNSGPSGSVAGQYGGAQQGRWKVADGMLHLSQDGTSWQPQPLQVTQNSNGSPIVKSGGREYMVCN